MSTSPSVELSIPVVEYGMDVFDLIKRCPPLDVNSAYCNILQCVHFSATSAAAHSAGELVGFVSGYRRPDKQDTLFVWQVAVSESMRGRGVARQMVEHILHRPTSRGIRFIEATIVAGNVASWALFTRIARRLGTEIHSAPYLDSQRHFRGTHDTEQLIRIGAFTTNDRA
jgi:L-2,4-diaminobutyric acid acetyltransferase